MFFYAHAVQESICHVVWLTASHWKTYWPIVSLYWWVPPLMNILMQPSDIFIMQMSIHPCCSKIEVSMKTASTEFQWTGHSLFLITMHHSSFLPLVQSTFAWICIMMWSRATLMHYVSAWFNHFFLTHWETNDERRKVEVIRKKAKVEFAPMLIRENEFTPMM